MYRVACTQVSDSRETASSLSLPSDGVSFNSSPKRLASPVRIRPVDNTLLQHPSLMYFQQQLQHQQQIAAAPTVVAQACTAPNGYAHPVVGPQLQPTRLQVHQQVPLYQQPYLPVQHSNLAVYDMPPPVSPASACSARAKVSPISLGPCNETVEDRWQRSVSGKQFLMAPHKDTSMEASSEQDEISASSRMSLARRLQAREQAYLEFESQEQELVRANHEYRARVAKARGDGSPLIRRIWQEPSRSLSPTRQRRSPSPRKAREESNPEYFARISEAGLRGKDVKRLSAGTEAMRRQEAQEHARLREVNAKQMAESNREYSCRIAEARAHGRDVKVLDAATEELRQKEAELNSKKDMLRQSRLSSPSNSPKNRRVANYSNSPKKGNVERMQSMPTAERMKSMQLARGPLSGSTSARSLTPAGPLSVLTTARSHEPSYTPSSPYADVYSSQVMYNGVTLERPFLPCSPPSSLSIGELN